MTARPDAVERSDVEWFERTGHCGRCGQPGDYCTCTAASPCGCGHLHPVDSARDADALDRFAAPGPDQDGLF